MMAVRRTVYRTSLGSPVTWLSSAVLVSLFERGCSLSKFQSRPHLPIIVLLCRNRARAILLPDVDLLSTTDARILVLQ